MDKLKDDLKNINNTISDLESQITKRKIETEANVESLKMELAKIREDKRQSAIRNDFDSLSVCRRRENNIKFKIDAKWNEYLLMTGELHNLKRQKRDLESQIKLEEDKIKRKSEILSQMEVVLENYKKTQNLRRAAVDSNVNPDHAEQWFEWGKNNFNDTYFYFYSKITEIDNQIRNLEAQKLKDDMDRVIDAYQKTGSLKEASKMANVSYDTVCYWYEWGSRNFGSENVYFFKKIKNSKDSL